MGYEVIYKFHEKLTEGGYNYEETKTFKRKVGDPFEDVSLEQLAGAIMAQLARRDVWIIDVEAFELSKKQISFKETKGGIVLKNKKFLFDNSCSISVVAEDDSSDPSSKQTISENSSSQTNLAQPNPQVNLQAPKISTANRRPIDYCVFLPELRQVSEIKQKRLKLTEDKQYPVYEKKMGMGGEFYLIIDDAGKDQFVPSEYFVPAKIVLVGDKEVNFSATSTPKESTNLYWGGAVMDSSMPDIRGRK
jgi:hypothetical protein